MNRRDIHAAWLLAAVVVTAATVTNLDGARHVAQPLSADAGVPRPAPPVAVPAFERDLPLDYDLAP